MSLDIPRIRALCFDVDGTLRDTDDHLVTRLAAVLRPFHSLIPSKNPVQFSRRVIMAIEDPATWIHSLPDRVGFDHYLAHASDWMHRVGIESQQGSYLIIEGVKEMLESLYLRYPLAIVSARGQRGTQAFLDHFMLTGYFQAVASGQTCRHTKPYPDPILWASKRIGVPPESCLMIGDTTVDMRAGKAAGAQTVGVLCGFGEEKELNRTGADLILKSTPELAPVLLQREMNASQ
jgi:HAD superfamily hydrolase (TIGR01549 family)